MRERRWEWSFGPHCRCSVQFGAVSHSVQNIDPTALLWGGTMVGTFPRLVPDCGMLSHWGRNPLRCDETVRPLRGDGNHLLVQIFPLGGEKNLRRWQRHALRGEDTLSLCRIFWAPSVIIGPITTCGVATMSPDGPGPFSTQRGIMRSMEGPQSVCDPPGPVLSRVGSDSRSVHQRMTVG